MTTEDIAYICEWAESGNGYRAGSEARVLTGLSLLDWCTVDDTAHLNTAGLTIARLARENQKLEAAYEQACELAEDNRKYDDRGLNLPERMRAMRRNREELLK